jgi:hypothetical protein
VNEENPIQGLSIDKLLLSESKPKESNIRRFSIPSNVFFKRTRSEDNFSIASIQSKLNQRISDIKNQEIPNQSTENKI